MDRRRFLRGATVAGAGIVVAGSAAGGWRAQSAGLVSPDPRPFEPWSTLSEARHNDPLGLVAAAILASSPHNTQPWKFALTDGVLRITADTARHLGAMDPFRREMWIGLGAAAANAEAAGPGLGIAVGTHVVTASGTDGTGWIDLPFTLAQSTPVDPLSAAISQRQTNRAPYDGLEVPEVARARMMAQLDGIMGATLVIVSRNSAEAEAFAATTIEGTKAITADPEMTHDGHLWFRANARQIALHRDGVSIPTAGLSPIMSILGQVMPPPDAAATGRYWLANLRTQLASAAGFGLIVVDDLDDRTGQVAAGRLWQRLHLALTLEGLAAQPLNQLPEMVDRDRQLDRVGPWAGKLDGMAGGIGHVTFAFRFGRPIREVPNSARRPVEEVLA